MHDMPIYLGRNIKLIRTKWRLKQDPFGKLLGVKSHQVGSYESESHYPRLPALLLLEKFTGLPIYDLCIREVKLAEIPDNPLKEYKLITGEKNEKEMDFQEGSETRELHKKIIALLEENRELRIENTKLKNR